jgi:serine/threonine protein kinase
MTASPPRSGPAAPPAELGAFRVLSVLGEGGSGVVYSAQWGHREVALKVLRPALVATGRERDNFLAEARRLAEIDHPSVVKVLGCGELPDGRPYLAMEKLEGETLAARLRAGGPMSLAAAVHIFEQLASAVEALHGRGLVHRDLKPENVMLVRGDYAVLLDFGIAKDLAAPDSTVTQDGGVRGTPAYMAPERFFGHQASTSTDIYELAVVLYAMLVGRLPWDSCGDPEGRLNPRRPSELGVELPGGLEIDLLRALSTRVQSRPATVAELSARVRAAAGTAGVPTPARRTADLSTPTPAGAAAEGPGRLPYMPTTPALAPRYLSGESAADTRADPRRDRRGPSPGLVVGLTAAAAAAVVIALIVLLPGSAPPPADVSEEPVAGPPGVSEDSVMGAPGVSEDSVIGPSSDGDAAGIVRAARLHPADSRFVAGLRFRQLLRAPGFGPLVAKQRNNPDLAILSAVSAMCELDPFEHLDWVTVGMAPGDDEALDAVLSGDWDRETIESCLRGAGMLAGDSGEGALTRLALGDGGGWLGWVDDRTFLFTTREGVDAAWMEARLAGERSVLDERTSAALFKAVDRSATVWFIGDPGALLDDETFEGMPPPTAIYGAVALAADIRLEVGLRYPDTRSAVAVEAMIRKELDEVLSDPAARAMLGDIAAARDGTDVTVRAHLNALITQMAVGFVAAELDKL